MFYFVLNMTLSIMMLIIMFFSTYSMNNMDFKSTMPFECGYVLANSARKEFSLKFYIVGLVFLLFDAEIILLFPIISSFNLLINLWLSNYIIILLLMFVSLIYEWCDKSLEW